ncbi:MAG: putative transcriptional regulator [Clostridia bacterium]|nr:putative transcriptional regulator [Clostridia bacterium]
MEKKILNNLHPCMDGMNGENYAFCGAMAFLMESIGEKDYDYWFFTCVTGDTFTQIFNKKQNQYNYDCLSSAVFGKEHLEKVFSACGYDFTLVNNNELLCDKNKYIQKILEWIDKGIPVLIKQNENCSFSLIVGYENDGKTLLRFNLYDSDPTAYEFNLSENSNYALVFTGDKASSPSLAEVYRRSVYDIPNLIKRPSTEKSSFGREAFSDWAESIVDGRYVNMAANELNSGNAHTNYIINFGTNGCMKKFIRRVSELNPDMKELVEALYNISAAVDPIFFALMEMEGGFDMQSAKLADIEKMRPISNKIKENLPYCDEILKLFNKA